MKSDSLRTAWLVAIVALAGGVLLTLPAIPGLRLSLWGMHAWTFLPPLTVAAVVVAPFLWLAACHRLPFPRRIAAVTGLAALSGPAFYLLRDHTHLLGDGRLWISTLGDVRPFHPNEPLAFGAAVLGALGLRGAEPQAVAHRMELWSIAFGVVAVGLFLTLAGRLGRDDRSRWLALGLLAATATLQFGCGYVEAYPPLWVVILIYVLLGILALQGKVCPGWAGLALGIAVACHGAAVLLVPSLIALFVLTRAEWPRVALGSAGLVLPVAFAYLVLPLMWPGGGVHGVRSLHGMMETLGELLGTKQTPGGWILHQLNIWTLLAPGALGLVAIGLALPDARHEGTVRFLALAAVGLMLPILILDPEATRGAAADWDVFAAAAVPVTALTAALWARRPATTPSLRLALDAVVVVGLWTSFSFVALNATAVSAVERFTRLAEVETHPRARSLAYEALGGYYRDTGHMQEAAAMYGASLAAQPSNVRLIRVRAGVLSWAGRHGEAVKGYLSAAKADPSHPTIWRNLAMELERVGAADSAAAAWREDLVRHPGRVDSMDRLARLLLANPATRPEALELIRESLRLEPDQRLAGEMREILTREGKTD